MARDEQRVRISTVVGLVGGHILACAGRMRRTILLLTVVALAALVFASPALAAPGDLDESFDGDGKVTTVTAPMEYGEDLAIQPNGKIVVAGTSGDAQGYQGDFALARYNEDGSLDTSFDGDGKLTTDFGAVERASALAVQSNGKIVVAGHSNLTGYFNFALARYNPDGSLDTSFGDGGKSTVLVDPDTEAYAVAVQPDGKIVVAGYRNMDGDDPDVVVARYNEDGSLDGGASDSTPGDSFDGDGRLRTDFSHDPRTWGGSDEAHDLVIQPDGKIVVAGKTLIPGYPVSGTDDFALARYNQDGSPDTSFDGDGEITTDFGGSSERAFALTVQPDGRLVVAGQSYNSQNGGDFALARYNSNGSLDTSFDTDGKLTTPIGPGEDWAYDLAVQPEGKTVVAGARMDVDNGGWDFALARYNQDGSLDPLFDADGKLTTDLSPAGTSHAADQAKALAINPDGKIIVAGHSPMSSSSRDFALARYYGGDDATSPGSVANLGATSRAGGAIALSWTNPADGDFAVTRILRSRGGYATSPKQTIDQTKVYEGNATSYTDTGLTDGRWYFYTVYAMDNNGNWSVAATTSAVADSTPPSVTINAGPSGTVGTSSSFSFTSTDSDLQEFQCSLDNADFGVCTSPVEYSGLADGSHTFRVRAVDTTGNIGSIASSTWIVDATSPVAKITSGPNGPTRDVLPTFTWSGSDDRTATADLLYSYRFDNKPWTEYLKGTRTTPFTPLRDGPHTFYVRARDAVGNVTESPAQRSFTVDTQGPQTIIESAPSGTVSAGSARFTFSSEPGATFHCKLDDAPSFTDCGSPQKYTGLGNGDHTFQVRADDTLENTGDIASHTWTIAPETTSQDVPSGGTLTSDPEGDGATASDPVETSITSPVAGPVEVTESATVTESSAGYSLLGQQVTIHAPDATAENPLRFVFTFDSTLIPAGENKDTIQIFRNGVQVQNCADPTSSTATPDPCVLSRLLVGDDIQFTILTSHASAWNFGVDDIAPTVTVAPRNLATGVSPTANVTATFSEAMKKTTLNGKTFFLVKKGTTKKVPATLKYPSSRKVVLDPSDPLTRGATYVATITTGAKDLAGNALAAKKVWSFKVSR